MRGREPGALWRPPWRPGQTLLLIPVVLIVVIVVADDLLPYGVHLGPLLATAPAIAALSGGPRTTGAVGVLALLGLLVAGRRRGGLSTLNHEVQIISLVAVTGVIVVFCVLRERRQRELAQVRSVSEAAQSVVLRPVPPRVGPLRLASVYLAAAAEARIGGDLFAAARTEGATRLLIGDVRGKGLASISDASLLLCAFREAAHRHATLRDLIAHLESSLTRDAAEPDPMEFFITAALTEVPDDDPVIRLVTCGHPPPLLVHGRQVLMPQVEDPAPPLGMGECDPDDMVVKTFPYETGDLLVLYTDGVVEARDRSGAFYPLAERLRAWPGGDPEALVRYIHEDLLAHVGGRLQDDAAVLVVERLV
ncbi:PP2C family protein-serine/threonine phosphatase [Actinomadura sp. DC4]|uniref:PP2C family protein-serine/threonine phosphatase n=1 Tax=Actinomadura sp. DC4 TaxID=3055069 RepID=UPI0025B2171A|nr:PP2C family protein-serine/threonine phosphatase [Actinomadura sp. DC4]MDN3354668.1 PP2C family protein-serine/threonine phosphatase [Actinomadura sp. DC4]